MRLADQLKQKMENKLEWYLEKIKVSQCVILYGAGVSGRTILTWLKDNGLSPSVFIDNNPDKWGEKIDGVTVHSKQVLDEIQNRYSDYLIIISCGDVAIVKKELRERNISESRMLYIDPKWITVPDGLRDFIFNKINQYQQAYDLLADAYSQKTFVNMLKYKMTYDTAYIYDICKSSDGRYFDHEIIKDKVIRNYVDVGAYTGDTIEMFIKINNKEYENIYAFEPNSSNVKQMKKFIEENDYRGIFIYDIGIADKRQIMTFNTNSELATRIDESGNQKIDCNTLDNVLQDRPVDLIKMDIEGAELKALCGAKKLIKKYAPILAICVYHKPEDYYEIPLKIKEIIPDYKIYFRQYELSDTETICYAVKE